jgi:hypothetical protein
MTFEQVSPLLLAVGVALALVFIMRWRKRTFAEHMHAVADQEVCQHLAPALKRLLERGHVVRRVGQRHPDMPLEIHMAPAFDPRQLVEELNLADPVAVSERGVLICREDYCELHPLA